MVKSTRKFTAPYRASSKAPLPKEKGMSQDNVLYMGIDLGTSQSSIATSTGVRRTVQSIVGLPKDLLSQNRIKTPIVLGDHALKPRLAVDLYYPLERGVIKKGTSRDEEAAMQLIKQLIALARPQF